ncbi:hypothetical protein [Lignipirellula cremea]|uniref:Uncharacterized protein n=1 Tax=Lignipirellula cremea TaxID=2528010 RepID=A0A518E3F3_9BACT|nr:hypothetical protein [Lignipirellula cremea]QDU98619.1 hypothetical protein Pla8534_64900 [Lignipirellula cremea]
MIATHLRNDPWIDVGVVIALPALLILWGVIGWLSPIIGLLALYGCFCLRRSSPRPQFVLRTPGVYR